MGSPSCSTSGVISASKVISTDRTKLVSIYATSTTNALFTVKVWDSANSTTTSKKEVARLNLHAGGTAQSVEYDFHGAILAQGLYVEFSTGSGSVTVNFA